MSYVCDVWPQGHATTLKRQGMLPGAYACHLGSEGKLLKLCPDYGNPLKAHQKNSAYKAMRIYKAHALVGYIITCSAK